MKKANEYAVTYGNAEEVAAVPPYGGDMEGNHYDLRTARKKGNELSDRDIGK